MQVPLQVGALDAAIIDLDGTLVDTLGDFAGALGRMLHDLALPPIDATQIERMVGKGSEYLLRSVLNHVLAPMDEAQRAIKIEALFAQAWASYQAHYRAINGQCAQVYPGADQGLQALRARGLRLACLTNKQAALRAVARQCGWRRRGRRCLLHAAACRSAAARARVEHGHGLYQLRRLVAQAVCGGSAFLDQRGVLLGGLVHLRDGFAHLGHALALLGAGGADLAHDVGHAANGAHHLLHGGACAVHLR
jgi:beta-phosphoglucomutase-like phosphatase (HAD superfamily)